MTMTDPGAVAPDADCLDGTVSVRGLAFEFPGRVLWRDLSFEVAAGQVVAVCGQSGSGKTTLLHCVGSLERPAAGEIVVGGRLVAGLRGQEHRWFLRHAVGFGFQNSGLVASWSVRKNLEVGGVRTRGEGGEKLSKRAEAVFERFDFPADAVDVLAVRLSGGEQQRVSLMRLALGRPAVLLLDEPSSALDDVNTERLLGFVEDHCAAGGCALIATHDARVIARSHHTISL